MTIVSKILGLSRDIFLSHYYGATNISDVFFISLAIPTVLMGFISNGISTGYIPVYREVETNLGKKKANLFTGNIVNITLLLSTVVFLIVQLFTPQIVKMFAFGFEGDTLQKAITFTRLSVCGIFFIGVSSVFQRFLQVNDQFTIPGMIGIPYNLILITFIILSYTYNTYLLAVGSVFALASQVALMAYYSLRLQYDFTFSFTFRDEYVKKMLLLVSPLIVVSSFNQINQLIDRSIASTIIEGGISALSYASRINTLVQSLFVTTIAAVVYPRISKYAAEGDFANVKKTMVKSILAISIFTIPAMLGIMVFAVPIVSLIFGHGAFSDEALSMTGSALFYYSIGLYAISVRIMLAKVFYSLQNSRTPVIITSIALVINIGLNFILSRFMGINGLALATAISGIICMLLMVIYIRKGIGFIDIREFTISLVKVILSSVMMILIVYGIFNSISNHLSATVSIILTVGIGLLLYPLLLLIFRVEDIFTLYVGFKGKIKDSLQK